MNRTNAIVNAQRGLSRFIVAALAALLCMGVALHARAQGAEVDPPDRVARLSDLSGQIWLFAPETNEWVGVDRNRPLTTGDRIATDNGARAEITLGSTTLRLDSATELEIVQLDDRRYLVHLHSGSVVARLRNAQSVAEFVLETDEGTFRAQTVGRYRFDRFEQSSDLTVIGGQAIFEGRNSALPLTTGQHAQFWLDAGGAPQYNMVEPVRDAFAAWSDDRDRTVERPVAVRYVSPEMTGAEDLDRYGAWEQTPEYGPIWTPRTVPAGWAPYNAGHWAWVRPWGWTWVDEAPWGFAPFHYGRWVYHRDVWCWAPGTYVARPIYAPALVAWMGGPRVSVSINIGGGGPPVGWFPLAPREVYVPSYRTSSRYVREINITHVTNVTNITTIVNNTNGAADRRDFANRKFPNAVTVVPASVLTNRQAVAPAAAQIRDNAQIRALVADPRPGPVMIAAPVATPPAAPKPTTEARAPIRPPFEGRAPGVFGGRPAPGSPPGSPPVAGGPPRGMPPTGAAPGRPVAPVPTGQAAAPVPVRGGARPDGNRPDAARPGQVAEPAPAAIVRPPVRGGVAREPGAEAPGLRPGMAPTPGRAPQAIEPVRPTVAPPAAAPAPPVGAAPAAEERIRQGGRGSAEEARAPGRPLPPPPVNVAPPVRGAEPRIVEPPRREAPPRAIEAPRAVEAPRNVTPPPPPPRAVEPPPRAVAPMVAPPPPKPVEPVRPEPARVAPEQKIGKPEPPRREDKREDKRDDKRDPNERQR